MKARFGKYRLVVWDLDGTIANTDEAHKHVFEEFVHRVLGEAGVDKEEIQRNFGYGSGRSYEDSLKVIKKAFLEKSGKKYVRDYDDFLDEMANGVAKYLKEHQSDSVWMAGAEAVLAYFRDHGVPMALATNSDRCFLENTAERTGLDAYIDSRLQVCVSDVPNGKPSPDMIDKIINRMKKRDPELQDLQPEEVLLVGDSVTDLKTAIAAGIDCIIIPTDEKKLRQCLHHIMDLQAEGSYVDSERYQVKSVGETMADVFYLPYLEEHTVLVPAPVIMHG